MRLSSTIQEGGTQLLGTSKSPIELPTQSDGDPMSDPSIVCSAVPKPVPAATTHRRRPAQAASRVWCTHAVRHGGGAARSRGLPDLVGGTSDQDDLIITAAPA